MSIAEPAGAADPVGPDRLTMTLRRPGPPVRVAFDLRDVAGQSVGELDRPTLPTGRRLLRALNPLTSGVEVTFTLRDTAGEVRALIERGATGDPLGPSATVTTPDGRQLVGCEPHGVLVRTYALVGPGRELLATVSAAPSTSPVLDATGTPHGSVTQVPGLRGEFRFDWVPGTPAVVRLGCLAAMVTFQTGVLLAT